MFILTDGKNYVMENPMKIGEYISTTSPVQAREFTYKQARSLLQNKKKSLSWVKSYYMVNQETGEKCVDNTRNYKGNGGVYVGENDVDFDDKIIDQIYGEANSLIGIAGWSLTQLRTYEEQLKNGLSSGYIKDAKSETRAMELSKYSPAALSIQHNPSIDRH